MPDMPSARSAMDMSKLLDVSYVRRRGSHSLGHRPAEMSLSRSELSWDNSKLSAQSSNFEC